MCPESVGMCTEVVCPELVDMCPELVEGCMIITYFRGGQCGAVLAGVKAKPYGWPAASLDPRSGRRIKKAPEAGRGMVVMEVWWGWVGRSGVGFWAEDFLILWEKRLP
jgi:hypothetical protein